jgi:hypothetical protein
MCRENIAVARRGPFFARVPFLKEGTMSNAHLKSYPWWSHLCQGELPKQWKTLQLYLHNADNFSLFIHVISCYCYWPLLSRRECLLITLVAECTSHVFVKKGVFINYPGSWMHQPCFCKVSDQSAAVVFLIQFTTQGSPFWIFECYT